jgi:hypothetical protein
LTAYFKEQTAAFGEERVFAFGARSAGPRPLAANFRAFAAGLLATAVTWFITSRTRPDEPGWTIGSVIALFVGVFALLLDVVQRRRRLPKETAGLVIGPGGLAMEHGEVSGLLQWSEVRTVRIGPSSSFLSMRSDRRPSIGIDVGGATVRISDSFDRCLSEIHERIAKYWR